MKMLIQKVNIYNLFSQAEINVNKIMFDNSVQVTRGSQEPVIAHLVFNLTSKVDGNGSVTHNFESGPPRDHFNSNFDVIFLSHNIPKRNKLAEKISQKNP